MCILLLFPDELPLLELVLLPCEERELELDDEEDLDELLELELLLFDELDDDPPVQGQHVSGCVPLAAPLQAFPIGKSTVVAPGAQVMLIDFFPPPSQQPGPDQLFS